jgi:hypothetical protein
MVLAGGDLPTAMRAAAARKRGGFRTQVTTPTTATTATDAARADLA